ncbi:Heterokaryon incompatibility protein (HET) domain containing protein [Naviculisporaceae sp. PSN 640]
MDSVARVFGRQRVHSPVHLGNPSPFYDQINVPIDHSRHEIRLLAIFPGDWNDQIRAELRPVSLDANPQYRALSYVWGDTNNQPAITVNGLEFHVTKNLFVALRRLRPDPGNHHGGNDIEPLLLWVDAICIDQGNNEEKSAQVAMMARIYASCHECFVWLGEQEGARPGPVRYFDPEVPNSSKNRALLTEYAADFNKSPDELDYSFHTACFLYLLKDVGKHVDFRQRPFPPFWNGPQGKQTAVPDLYPEVWFPEVTGDFKTTYFNRVASVLVQIESAEWHTRMWVVQEYALPPVVVLCRGAAGVPLNSVEHIRDVKREGSCRVSLALALIFRAHFNRLGLARMRAEFYRPRLPRLVAIDGSKHVSGLRQGARLVSAFPTWFRLVVLSCRGTVFECCAESALASSTLPVDQVYSIISYLRFVGVPVDIQVHYSPESATDMSVAARDAAEVFEQVSREHIMHPNGRWSCRYEPLAPLRFSRGKTERIRQLLPSWAVDWSGHAPPSNKAAAKITIPGLFKANDGMKGGVRPKVDGRVLRVSGAELDLVDEVVDLRRGIDAWHRLNSWVEQDPEPYRYPGGESLREALLRTLTLDIPDRGYLPWSDHWAFWARHWDAFKHQINEVVATRAGWFEATNRKHFRDILSSASVDFVDGGCRVVGVYNIFFAAILYLHGNCIFRTRAGYFGLGGEEISKGDEVYVLTDGTTPFVLRKQPPDSGLELPSPGTNELFDSGSAGRRCGNDNDIQRPLLESQQSPCYRVVISECFIHGVMYGEASKMRLKESIVEIV